MTRTKYELKYKDICTVCNHSKTLNLLKNLNGKKICTICVREKKN